MCKKKMEHTGLTCNKAVKILTTHRINAHQASSGEKIARSKSWGKNDSVIAKSQCSNYSILVSWKCDWHSRRAPPEPPPSSISVHHSSANCRSDLPRTSGCRCNCRAQDKVECYGDRQAVNERHRTERMTRRKGEKERDRVTRKEKREGRRRNGEKAAIAFSSCFEGLRGSRISRAGVRLRGSSMRSALLFSPGSSVTYVQRKTGAEKNNRATRISGKRRGEKEEKGDAEWEMCNLTPSRTHGRVIARAPGLCFKFMKFYKSLLFLLVNIQRDNFVSFFFTARPSEESFSFYYVA